ncbi:MAG: toll/interleukin-1 receptor domain-containing protein, partial [Clostridia bacterium]|nr:toll/interleukin-1 receptor domain-containing protein [Clostridia bacterium]
MTIFKCKMCGADLPLIEGSNVCECEYCGTTQTVPTADNDKKMNLFNRANRLRFANEFDKAAGVFESIVSEFPEEAEAYWGLCLCKYGIEYVDDPATAKKIPTCHRTSYDSIFNDSNFEMAQEYADVVARKIYRDEAKEIDRLQKSILAIAQNEEPFDIFICYKETAEDGQRTIDSVLAQNMYDALTEKGYKVFFARITLEDKLGQEYEPYIFSALSSAKVMLAVGTNYDYYNAVWVKNEWSRFLDMMKTDKKKVLIPCYKDIDAYDIPKEFKHLQAQDMGKVGFMQDLIRGIGKIIPLENDSNTTAQAAVNNTVVVQQLQH